MFNKINIQGQHCLSLGCSASVSTKGRWYCFYVIRYGSNDQYLGRPGYLRVHNHCCIQSQAQSMSHYYYLLKDQAHSPWSGPSVSPRTHPFRRLAKEPMVCTLHSFTGQRTLQNFHYILQVSLWFQDEWISNEHLNALPVEETVMLLLKPQGPIYCVLKTGGLSEKLLYMASLSLKRWLQGSLTRWLHPNDPHGTFSLTYTSDRVWPCRNSDQWPKKNMWCSVHLIWFGLFEWFFTKQHQTSRRLIQIPRGGG